MQDPTIKSVLVVLDNINKKFHNDPYLLQKLNKISFLFEEVVTDAEDLYIKLNSRGKPLDDFEIFKANLIGQLQEDKNRNYQNFIAKLESWANIFEKLSVSNKTEKKKTTDHNAELEQLIKNTDDSFLHFLTCALACEHFISYGNPKPPKDYHKQYIKDITNGTKELSPKNILSDIEETLDLLNLQFDSDNPSKDNIDYKTYLTKQIEINGAKAEYKQLLYLFVLLKAPKGADQTAQKNRADFIDFFKKMISNSDIDSFSTFQNALQSVAVRNQENIYLYLAQQQPTATLSGFSQHQYQEEILKAKCSGTLLEKIRASEKDIYYLDGNLASLLVFSANTGSTDLPQNPTDIDENKFDLYSKLLKLILNIAQNDNDNQTNDKNVPDFLVPRALLTEGDYLLSAKNNSKPIKYFLENKLEYYNWKVFLSQTQKEKRQYMKALLDHLIEKLPNAESSSKLKEMTEERIKSILERIIEDSKIADWRKYFIEDKEYIKESLHKEAKNKAKCIKSVGRDINLQGSRNWLYWNYYVFVLKKKLGRGTDGKVEGKDPYVTYGEYTITLSEKRYIQAPYFKIEQNGQEIPLINLLDGTLKTTITDIEAVIYHGIP